MLEDFEFELNQLLADPKYANLVVAGIVGVLECIKHRVIQNTLTNHDEQVT